MPMSPERGLQLRKEGKQLMDDASSFLVQLCAEVAQETLLMDASIDHLEDEAEEEIMSKWAVLDDADDKQLSFQKAAAKLEDIQTALKVALVSEEKEKREADEAEAQLVGVKVPLLSLQCIPNPNLTFVLLALHPTEATRRTLHSNERSRERRQRPEKGRRGDPQQKPVNAKGTTQTGRHGSLHSLPAAIRAVPSQRGQRDRRGRRSDPTPQGKAA
jgi:hypothetical protein